MHISTRIRNATRYAKSLWTRRELAWYMAMGNLSARNASTALGLMWWVLNPLLMGAVYYLVFGVILDVSRDLSYLLSGIFVFYYTSTAITSGANSILSNTRLLTNLSFPRMLLPITAILEVGIGFLVSIPALYLIIGPTDGHWPTAITLLVFPAAFACQTIFNLGLAAGTARIAIPFRDINNLVPHLTRIWLYLSPILFSATKVQELGAPLSTLMRLNPMYSFLAVYRAALIDEPLQATSFAAMFAWTAIALLIGTGMFIRFEGKMARYL